jgi:hypothetical protein
MQRFGTIEFEMRDWENGFYVTFRIPFSAKNMEVVLTFRNSANIRIIQ